MTADPAVPRHGRAVRNEFEGELAMHERHAQIVSIDSGSGTNPAAEVTNLTRTAFSDRGDAMAMEWLEASTMFRNSPEPAWTFAPLRVAAAASSKYTVQAL